MRLIKQIKKDIDKTKGISLASVCRKAGVNYQTVLRALKNNQDMKESTLVKLVDALDKQLVLIDKNL